MKMSYKILSYVVFATQLMNFCLKIKSFKKFDLMFFSSEGLYLLIFGLVGIFVLFQFDKYNHYLNEHSGYLILRYQSFRHIFNNFVFDCFIQSGILTIIKIIIELIIFHKVEIISEVFFYLVILMILMLHFNLEISFGSKAALIIVLIYLVVSLMMGDILKEAGLDKGIYFFALNFLFPSRVHNIFLSLVVIFLIIVCNYMMSRIIIQRKEIY